MGWVHLKIWKAISLEIANQFIIFFQGRFKWTQILFVKIKNRGPVGKVSLTCGDIFYRQTSFRMRLVSCSFTVSNKKCFRQQKEPIIFEMSIPAKAMGSYRWQYFWNLQTTSPDKILFANVNFLAKNYVIEWVSILICLFIYVFPNKLFCYIRG